MLRIDHPECSKSKGVRVLAEKYGINFPTHDIYLAMDELLKCSDRAMSLVFDGSMRLHGGKIEHLLFDVTTTYAEQILVDMINVGSFTPNTPDKLKKKLDQKTLQTKK